MSMGTQTGTHNVQVSIPDGIEDGDHVILGGVRIPFTKKLKGHSDADVGLHALTDAIFGALAEGDILAATASKWYGIDQLNVQMLLAFFQACVFMFLAMGGWHLGLMVYGLDEDEIIRKASDPIPANSNVRPFRPASDTQTIVVDNRDPKVMAAIEALTRKAS